MIFLNGTSNNLDTKIKKFLSDFSKKSLDNSKGWEKMIWDFFSKEAFVFYVGTIQKSEKSLDMMWGEIKKHYLSWLEGGMMIFDTNEIFKSLIQINEFLKQGGEISDFYRFFFMNNLLVRQMNTKKLDEDDSSFKKFGAEVSFQNWTLGKDKNKLYQRVWLIKADNSIIYPNEKYFEEVDELLNKEVKKIMNQSPKSNTRKRNPIESRLRHEVFKRDNYKCLECGKTNKNATLHADHIIPVAQGGADELDNLQTLCQACNLAKSNRKWNGGKMEQTISK